MVGLRAEVQRCRWHCPLRSRLRDRGKTIAGLERSSGASGLRKVACVLFDFLSLMMLNSAKGILARNMIVWSYGSHVNIAPPPFASFDFRLSCLCVACIYARSVWSGSNNTDARCLGQGSVEASYCFLRQITLAVYRMYYRYYCYPHFRGTFFFFITWMVFTSVRCDSNILPFRQKAVYLPPRALKLTCALVRMHIVYRVWFVGNAY